MNLTRTERLKVRDRDQIAQQSIELKTSRRKEQYSTIEVGAAAAAPKAVEQPPVQRPANSKYGSIGREEYLQMYGSSYSPWVQRPSSKDTSLDHDTNQDSIELVAGKRKSRIFSGVDSSLTHRPGSIILESKLTLPKLNGRYSLLSKYATVDASGTITSLH